MEKRYLSQERINLALTNKFLRLCVLGVETCNFNCIYCPQDHIYDKTGPYPKDHATRFPGWTAKQEYALRNGILRKIKTDGLQTVSLAWFGGEPMLNVPLIERLSQFILEQDLQLTAGITTNGSALTLLNFEKLRKSRVKAFKISFDGDKSDHDLYRVRKKGTKGTFDRIWSNLLKIKETTDPYFKIILRIHINPFNVERAPAFYDKVLKTFLDDSRFLVEIEAISNQGGESYKKNFGAAPILHKDKDPNMVAVKLRNQLPKQNRVYYFDQSITDAPKCATADPNSWVVRAPADGSELTLGKCTVQLNWTVGKIGFDGKWGDWDAEKLRPFTDPWGDGTIETIDVESLECNMRSWFKKKKQTRRY